MARLGRTFLPDQPRHVIQRRNNRGAIFFCEDDDAQNRGRLAEAAEAHNYRIMAAASTPTSS
jgi:REP element-mobilizing transposase RayT